MSEQQPEAPAVLADELASLRRSCRILAGIIARNHQAMEAARIEMLQNGPHAGMQWVLNSLPDLWDDDETAWDGRESAQAWFDRTEDFYRAAKENAEALGIRSPSLAPAVPLADGTEPAGGTWRERAEAAEARLAEIADHCRLRMQRPGRSGMTMAAAGLILGIAEGSEEAGHG